MKLLVNYIKNLLLLAALLGATTSFLRPVAEELPADKSASPQTIALYKNLKKLAAKGFMFGHQDDLAYGVNWRYETGRSDVKEVAGDYPAVYGWELGGLEAAQDKNIDGVPFTKMRQYIKEGYERGGVITISWHARSPYGAEKGAWDTTHGTVASILPGGNNHQLYKTWLDELAKFFQSLKGSKGEAIPVLFRPYHELTGNWFWWCRNACNPEEFKILWRFTQNYLREEKKVHNLLYIYNTAEL
jgi:mannan endo-1,4-beta-mannosidase